VILHSVYLRLSDGAEKAELLDIMSGLEALRFKLDGMTDFRHGPNHDFEGKSTEYSYGFLAEFVSTEALKTYADDAEHAALGARLVALCDGGATGIIVFDLEAGL
jgi:hypothetical protein